MHICKWKNGFGSNYSRIGGEWGKKAMMEGINSSIIY
jgi:hypothetical protein